MFASLALFLSLASAQAPTPVGDAAPPTEAAAEPAAEPMPTREEVIAALKEQGANDADAASMADAILARWAVEQSLTYQTGDIPIAEGKATLHIPDGYGYLNPTDCDKVLVAWGNPPGGGGEGMLVPAGLSPFSDGGWGVVISYEEDGHVEDDDADEIDYAELLEEMQKDTEDSNAARTQAGYSAIHLRGWAEPPHYDGANHKLYWAKILTSDDGGESLNYDIRVLGRKGVLSMSAIASTEALAQVKTDMEQVITFAEFNDGHRYLDFDPDIDEVAAYGIGALVAGKLAAKVGLLKGLFALLLAGKKFVVIAVVGLGAWLKNLFTRKGSTTGGDGAGT